MQKNKLLWAILACIVVAIIGIVYMFVGEATLPPQQEKPSLVTFDGADIKEEKDGKLVWKISAEKILYNPQTKEVFLTNPTAEFYRGDSKMIITAVEGAVLEGQTKISLKGKITGSSTDGVTLEAEDVMYLSKENKFYSNRPFRYTKGTVVISGDTFSGDAVLEQIVAKGHVKLTKE